MRIDFPIIALVYLHFDESMAFIEGFGWIIGHLYMEVDF